VSEIVGARIVVLFITVPQQMINHCKNTKKRKLVKLEKVMTFKKC